MSQAGIINVAGGGGGGSPVQTVSTPDGTATPISNDILIDAFDSIDNFDNGITTKAGLDAGDPPNDGNGAANEVSIYLTNRATGTNTTSAAESVTVISLDTADILPALAEGLLSLVVDVIAYNADTNTGSSWHIEGALIHDGLGGLATVGTPVRNMIGNSAVFDVSQVTVSFSGSSITVLATGSGGNVRWTGLLTYRFGGGV